MVRLIEGDSGAIFDLVDIKGTLNETVNKIPSQNENYHEFKDMSLIFEQNGTDEDAEIVLFLKGDDGFS